MRMTTGKRHAQLWSTRAKSEEALAQFKGFSRISPTSLQGLSAQLFLSCRSRRGRAVEGVPRARAVSFKSSPRSP
jgi:hypothetical protein